LKTFLSAFAVVLSIATLAAITPEVIHSSGAVPPHVAGRFRDAKAFQQSASRHYFVFDRRAHVVYALDESKADAWPIVHVGPEPGRIIGPTAFSLAPDGSFVVADTPGDRDRVQVFGPSGFRTAGFMLPGRTRPRVTLGNLVLSGIGSLQYDGTSILMSQPETGALVTVYALSGSTSRSLGRLRATGHEHDPDVHLALNSGFPLADPRGGFYFVFQAGRPVFQKYDADGHLLFERHVQGLEVDEVVAQLPSRWPRMHDELPVVAPTIRAAAVDRQSRLWLSFAVPYTYVFDAEGDKVRVVQFRAAGILSPDGLFFGPSGRLLATPGLYEFDVGP
jgi:hypothetical protein